MEIGYLGGIVKRDRLHCRPPSGWNIWHWEGRDTEAFLYGGGAGCRVIGRDQRAVLIRGAVADTWSRHPFDLERLADKLFHVYLDQGILHIDGLEGSFTLALVDGLSGRALVYRNLVGDSNTYYRETLGGVLFASNLANLVAISPETVRSNDGDLPTLFLNRTIPGRNTLFAGHHRLLPGEQLQRKDGAVTQVQRRTLGDLRESHPVGREALDRLESTTEQICTHYRSQTPEASPLLSGGVDSSYLAMHWNRIAGTKPRSYCVALDHERTSGDREYAESAAAMLGNHHTVVWADAPYADQLHDTLDSTGELPNHVQLAFYPVLARAMSEQGATAAINGDGADSLFGLAIATQIQNAAFLRRLLPSRLLRKGGAKLASLMKWSRLCGYFKLADYLHNEERLEHPVNRAAVFADWAAVETCFGTEAVANVAAERRALLDRYHVPDNPLERIHAAGFLGSAMNTAALTTTMYARHGVRTLTPFLDSRMLRLAVNLAPKQRFRFRQPKALLKSSLARHGFGELAYRSKKSFGQPIFEWLAPGGQLAGQVAGIDNYPFVDASALETTKGKPTWFLYTLLCYDLWHKRFIRQIKQPLAA